LLSDIKRNWNVSEKSINSKSNTGSDGTSRFALRRRRRASWLQ